MNAEIPTSPNRAKPKPGKRRGVVLIAVLLVVTILALVGYQYGGFTTNSRVSPGAQAGISETYFVRNFAFVK